MERIDQNDAIFTFCQGDVSASILRTVLYPPEAHSEPTQASKMHFFFARIVDAF